MEERIPIHTIDGLVSVDGEPDGCVRCSEDTVYCCCGRRVKRWCILIAFFLLVTIGLLISLVIYAVRFGEATSCRLTYADDAAISEAEMQSWMAGEEWPLSVPTYDWKRRACVCKGFENTDPKSLMPTDEVLAWIAPGDLASLSDEGKITPLPAAFLTKYRGAYGEKDHVKVCLQQRFVLDLWNLDPSRINVADQGRHCHVSYSEASSNVEKFYLGWDGALYCTSPPPGNAVARMICEDSGAVKCKTFNGDEKVGNTFYDAASVGGTFTEADEMARANGNCKDVLAGRDLSHYPNCHSFCWAYCPTEFLCSSLLDYDWSACAVGT